ncbi:uncharacterized protein TDEL_0A07340 [Torulaspora delbrueckii]|uniref:Ankyrin repeat-containing protein YCR051W n=1 Tax=Torulaspora delbrueckii TaxID=4950 RepID=G8ZN72_TORDE|nr:hypothetical protein TDEL_0A07340 [Torulaspora delbrueckii]CCE90066.1 hypothetical protein TDEL_0A07340 [Torulaspora delbrueckii]
MNIWTAASDGREDVVEQLLAQNNGLNANSKDPNGYTSVHAAAAYGHIELLKKLCKQYNGDINIRDNDGDTPLHHCEDVNTAKIIVEVLGGDISLTNEEGKTALQSFEEDAEFPELIQYMRLQSGIPQDQDSLGIDADQLQQFRDNIRYTLETEPEDLNDPESQARRKKLEQIIQGENAEQELENYIREIIRSQIMTNGEPGAAEEQKGSNAKRRK